MENYEAPMAEVVKIRTDVIYASLGDSSSTEELSSAALDFFE